MPDRRLSFLLAAVIVLTTTVYGRLIALQVRDGNEYRAVAAEPTVRRHTVAAARGRILARDGTVLAYDDAQMSLAVEYRWLEEPPDPRWLRQMARAQLTAAERRNPQAVAAAQQHIVIQRRDLALRLATLCGLTDSEWEARRQKIQARIESIGGAANARQQLRADARSTADSDGSSNTSFIALAGRSIAGALFATDQLPHNPRITVAEELDAHVICTDLSLQSVAEIETHSELYPGVKLQPVYRRVYPEGQLAAHVLGYLGAAGPNDISKQPVAAIADIADAYQPDDRIGRAGLERQYESILRAHRGITIDRVDARGQTIETKTLRDPTPGRDLMLTVDPAVQRAGANLTRRGNRPPAPH